MDPGDRRLCPGPDGDRFRAIRRGQASVVTDRIVEFPETGLRLGSGPELEADLVAGYVLRLLAQSRSPSSTPGAAV